MRGFFIQSLEKIVNFMAVLSIIGVVLAALGVMFFGTPQGGGFLAGLAVLVVGALYVVLIFGGIYLALGIYENTRRTAEATEQLARR